MASYHDIKELLSVKEDTNENILLTCLKKLDQVRPTRKK